MKPLSNNLIIEREGATTKLPNGLENPLAEPPCKGRVISVGRNIPLMDDPILVDDTIIFKKNQGTPIEVDGKDYLVLNINDITAIL